MSVNKISNLASTAALLLFAGSSFAYDCSTVPAYAQGAYSTGAIVKNVGSAFRCDVGGWCSVGGPYEPGVGWANAHAWTNLGSCDGDVLPSSSSARSVASSSAISSSVRSSSIAPSSSSAASDVSCAPARIWDSNTIYVRGDVVSHQGATYRARWWTQNQAPSSTSDVWELIKAACGSSSSSVRTSSSAPSSASSSSVTSSVGSTGLRIVGYVPSWSGVANNIQYNKLTHINYAFVLPTSEGYVTEVPNPELLRAVVSRAHANGVKVALSVGGWNNGDDSAFVALAANATKQARFRVELLKKVDEFNLDGIDIDWEYPDPDTAESTNYTTLMRLLSYDLRVKGKYLTAAVVGDGYTGNGVEREVFDHVEFLNLMAYDQNNGDHSSYAYAVTSLNYWTGRGLAADKTVLGVPYYARPSWAGYNVKVGQNINNQCRDTDGSDYWNGIPTIRNKALLARNYGGIMTWELSQDTNGADSLLTAMWEVMTFKTGSFICR